MNQNREILRKEDLYAAILAGVRENLKETRAFNKGNFTQAKKNQMRDVLKQKLLEDFKPFFVDVNVSREEATNFISYLVDMELAKA